MRAKRKAPTVAATLGVWASGERRTTRAILVTACNPCVRHGTNTVMVVHEQLHCTLHAACGSKLIGRCADEHEYLRDALHEPREKLRVDTSTWTSEYTSGVWTTSADVRHPYILVRCKGLVFPMYVNEPRPSSGTAC